jgi:hypothetical protein
VDCFRERPLIILSKCKENLNPILENWWPEKLPNPIPRKYRSIAKRFGFFYILAWILQKRQHLQVHLQYNFVASYGRFVLIAVRIIYARFCNSDLDVVLATAILKHKVILQHHSWDWRNYRNHETTVAKAQFSCTITKWTHAVRIGVLYLLAFFMYVRTRPEYWFDTQLMIPFEYSWRL